MTVSDFSFPPPTAPTKDENEKGVSWDDSVSRMKIGIIQLQLQNTAEMVHYVHRNLILTKGYEVELRDLGWQLAMQNKRLSKLGAILKQQYEGKSWIEKMVDDDRVVKVYDEMDLASKQYTNLESLFLECTGVPLPELGSKSDGKGIEDEWDRLPNRASPVKDFQVCKSRYVSRQTRISALQSYVKYQDTETETNIRRCFWTERLSKIKFAGARRHSRPFISSAQVCATLTDSMKEDFERAILHRTPPISKDYTPEQTQFFFNHRKNHYTYMGQWLVERDSGLGRSNEFEAFQKAVAGNWKQYTEENERYSSWRMEDLRLTCAIPSLPKSGND